MTSGKGDGCNGDSSPSTSDFQYLARKLRSHRVLTEDLDAAADALAVAADRQEQLRAALAEAMEWNWLEENAGSTIPSEVWKQCEGALAGAPLTSEHIGSDRSTCSHGALKGACPLCAYKDVARLEREVQQLKDLLATESKEHQGWTIDEQQPDGSWVRNACAFIWDTNRDAHRQRDELEKRFPDKVFAVTPWPRPAKNSK